MSLIQRIGAIINDLVTSTKSTWSSQKIQDEIDAASDPTCAPKQGEVLPGAFAGTPKTATVTFAAAYPDADYTPTVTTESGDVYDISVESITSAGFTINLNSAVGPANNVRWAVVRGDCTGIIAANIAPCQIVADYTAANLLTGLKVGDCVAIGTGFNKPLHMTTIVTTPDGTFANAVTHTSNYLATGSISDNTGGGDITTAIPANNTLYELQSNGSVQTLQNMSDASSGNSQRIQHDDPTNDNQLKRFQTAFVVSFEGASGSVYRFAIRTRTSGGSTTTFPTGVQVTAKGTGQPVHATLIYPRQMDDGVSVYLMVERLSGGGSGDITLKEYTANVLSTTFQTNA